MNVAIINDFLVYPTIVREWAIKQQYYSAQEYTKMYNSHTDWPGKRTLHVADLNKEYADTVLSRIANIAVQQFGLRDPSIKSFFQLTTISDGDSWVHQDNNVDVAGVLYLNPGAPVDSGTSLYKCKDEVRWNSFMCDQEGYNTLKTLNRKENKELYNEIFETVDVIGNVFNRLIMYKGTEYHKSNDYFGNSIQDGRLTQIFFLKGE